ncbi:NAD(P)/FAD-dependent oxidoreductase [Aureimonas fodinaquatilis]|nr:FAD-binding oxidoreductase [Aureimonas fodinaquatilis]
MRVSESDNPAFQHPQSVWTATGTEVPALPTLQRRVQTDAVIIGAGFTGLNAAWELSQRGVSCVVLEASDLGWGASGRNGGMAVLRYKKPWSTLSSSLGEEKARRLYKLIHEAVDTLEENVQTLQLECGFQRCGHITAATNAKATQTLQKDIEWLSSSVQDNSPRMLSADEMREHTGSSIYTGSYLDKRSAGVHPLDYSRQFGQALLAKGVEIYGGSAATSLTSEGDWIRVDTPGGSVQARKVLICNNAYPGTLEQSNALIRRVLPMTVAVIATAPLPDDLSPAILPNGELVTDMRNLVNYYRRTPDGGLLFGGRGSFTGTDSPKFFNLLHSQLGETFPQLRDIEIRHHWTGHIAMTLDHFPHMGALGNKVFYALGYGGRGVALSNLLGKHLARLALGEKNEMVTMSDDHFEPIPLRGLHLPIMQTAAFYYRFRDKFGI